MICHMSQRKFPANLMRQDFMAQISLNHYGNALKNKKAPSKCAAAPYGPAVNRRSALLDRG